MLKSRKQLFAFILFVAAISFAFPAFAQYTPMVRIPGLPATGSISLSMYLVGLYNFMVSIVGIVAVMMMIVGGMRYITAGGSSSAIGDAKDIISNAIAGLVIAIFAWVIVAAINPDVLYIKKPGLSTVASVTGDCINPAGGSYIAPNTCICADGANISAAGAYPASSDCNNACKVGSHCVGINNSCIRDGVDSTIGPSFTSDPNRGKCLCIDGRDIVPGAFTSCQSACAVADCISADAKLGAFTNEQVTNLTITDLRRLSTGDGTRVSPYYITDPDTCNLVLEGELYSFVNKKPATYQWDSNWDGTYDVTQPYIAACFTYNAILAAAPPECFHTTASPKAYICPTRLKVTDSSGAFKEDVLYFGWLE